MDDKKINALTPHATARLSRTASIAAPTAKGRRKRSRSFANAPIPAVGRRKFGGSSDYAADLSRNATVTRFSARVKRGAIEPLIRSIFSQS